MRADQRRDRAGRHFIDDQPEEIRMQLVDMNVRIADCLRGLEIAFLMRQLDIINHRGNHRSHLDQLVPGQVPGITCHDGLGALRRVAGIVTDPLEALRGAHRGQNTPKIIRTRRPHGDDAEHHLVDLGLEKIELAVLFDHHVDPACLEVGHGPKAGVQLAAGQHAEPRQVEAEIIEVLFKCAAGMGYFRHHDSFRSRSALRPLLRLHPASTFRCCDADPTRSGQ